MYDAVVIGGGPAGSATAIGLARRGYRVLLLEKQRYPVHKLCGEFLSTEVQAAFKRLGVYGAVLQAGARPVEEAFVTAPGGAAFKSALPGKALALSRYALDRLLIDQARASGVEVLEGTAARSITGSLEAGFVVEADRTVAGRMVFGAYGKRGMLDRKLSRSFMQARTPYVAFKAHYTGISLPAVVELHAFQGGYCGLVQVEKGRINACWIGHEEVLKNAGGSPEVMIERALKQNDVLARRFEAMQRVSDTFLAVSQVSLSRKEHFAGDVCMVGDTAAMIAPLCGDGMAMALHASELAASAAADFLDGRLTDSAFRKSYAIAWKRAFQRRLRLGRWIHYGFMSPIASGLGVRVCARIPALADWLIRSTRG